MSTRDKEETTLDVAPASAETIRYKISQGLTGFSKSERVLADFTLQHYGECAMLNISEIADACGVSNATVNRFARTVGFQGYHDYRTALRRENAPMSTAELFKSRRHAGDAVTSVRLSIQQDVTSLQTLGDTVASAPFEEMIESLQKARRIFVFGQGSSTYLAGYFIFNLRGMGLDCVELSARTGIEGVARALLVAQKDDLFIPIAFPRFSALTIEMTRVAYEQKCRVFSISSTDRGPLAETSHHMLIAPPRVELHSGSGVSAMAIIDGILSALADQAKSAEAAAKRLSPMIDPHLFYA